MTDYYPIVGIKTGDETRPPVRREVNSWSTNYSTNVQVSLFVRALQQFYSLPYTDPKSFFQVASNFVFLSGCTRHYRLILARYSLGPTHIGVVWSEEGWPLLCPSTVVLFNLASAIYAPLRGNSRLR